MPAPERSTVSDVTMLIEAPPEGGQSRRGFVVHTLRHRPAAVLGTAILVLVALGAILAPWIAPYPLHQQVGPVFGHPSLHRLLGLDDGGIDIRHRNPIGPQLAPQNSRCRAKRGFCR